MPRPTATTSTSRSSHRTPSNERHRAMAGEGGRSTRPQQLHGGPGSGFDAVEHLVDDDDPDTALCGIDQTDVPWNQGFLVCQACLAVSEGRMS